VEDVDIIGSDNRSNSGIVVGADSATIRRCDISGVENGIFIHSASKGHVIEDNYLHDLAAVGNPDPHYDGIQFFEAEANTLIRNNNLALDRNVSSCITMKSATNVDIINNRLNGGTYIIYFEGNSSGCDVTGNRFGQYVFGRIAGASANAQTYSGNVDDATGNSVSLP
jgi:nitrous oxidase accessory protein NosD